MPAQESPYVQPSAYAGVDPVNTTQIRQESPYVQRSLTSGPSDGPSSGLADIWTGGRVSAGIASGTAGVPEARSAAERQFDEDLMTPGEHVAEAGEDVARNAGAAIGNVAGDVGDELAGPLMNAALVLGVVLGGLFALGQFAKGAGEGVTS